MHFDAFLAVLPSGIQLFSLFANHPLILELVAEIMGDAPALADWLSRNPSLLDHVLSPEFGKPLGTVGLLCLAAFQIPEITRGPVGLDFDSASLPKPVRRPLFPPRVPR